MENNISQHPHKASPVLVKQANIFADLPTKLIEDFQQEFQLSEWHKGEYFNSALLTQRFFVVLDGQVEIKQTNPSTGREATLDMLYAGDCFDLIVLLDGQPHDVIVSPITTVKLLSVKIETMRQWLWNYPEFNQQFMPYLALKMREKEELASSLILQNVTTRLSRIILKHINKMKFFITGKQDDQPHIVKDLNDDTLARMAGTVRQIVNKQLQQWKKDGTLDKKRNQLIIKDIAALEKEAKYPQSLSNTPWVNTPPKDKT